AGDGSWAAEYGGGGCDTCFALLCLKRANLASDLTASLRTRSMRAGGSSGADLVKSKPGAANEDKAPNTKPGATKEPPAAAPPASRASDPEAARLSDELASAPAGQQEQVLEKLRDSK